MKQQNINQKHPLGARARAGQGRAPSGADFGLYLYVLFNVSSHFEYLGMAQHVFFQPWPPDILIVFQPHVFSAALQDF